MSTVRPKHSCRVRRKLPNFDRSGRAQHSTASLVARCAIVWLRDEVGMSSVRTDSSASRGNAEETTAAARFLFPARTSIATGDLVEITVGGIAFVIEATSVFPRPDVDGVIDHLQVDGELWASD